jgi:hypothetical protein
MSQRRNISDIERYELRKVAKKSRLLAFTLGFFISPLAYVYLGKWKWAVINFFTVNYLMLGFFIVPLHTVSQISDARDTLDAAGVQR